LEETRTVLLSTRSVAARKLEVPTRVGNVKLGDLVGEGGGGVVFSGFDCVLNRRTAVKVMFPPREVSGAELDAMVAGVRVAARIKHPNIVGVHTVETFNGMPVIVMEFVAGMSARTLLAKLGAVDETLTSYLMRPVASAVAAMHEAGVLHRDLKPANVLVDRDGVPFVCDFGLACSFDARRVEADAEQIGGSPRYMAPEMFDGHVTPQSDVYALGIMLFELLTGTAPFHAETISAIHAAHARDPLPVALLEQRRVSPALCDVISRATHKQGFLRYKSAAHLLRAMEGCCDARRDPTQKSRLAAIVSARDPDLTGGQTPGSDFGNTFELLKRRADEKRRERGRP
jgi:serine/threonine-protein kinase